MIEAYQAALQECSIGEFNIYQSNGDIYIDSEKGSQLFKDYVRDYVHQKKLIASLKKHIQIVTNNIYVHHFNEQKDALLKATVLAISPSSITIHVMNYNAVILHKFLLMGESVYVGQELYVITLSIKQQKNSLPLLICTRKGPRFTENFLKDQGITVSKTLRYESYVAVVFTDDNISPEIITRYKNETKEILIAAPNNTTNEELVYLILSEYRDAIKRVEFGVSDIAIYGYQKDLPMLIGKFGINSKILNKIFRLKVQFLPHTS